MEPTTFINLSGGIDSTYYLWRWLRENPNESIRVHHCYFNESRKDTEQQATDSILQWLRDNGLGNFEYVKTIMSKGSIKEKTHDVEMIGAIAGFACRKKSIKNVLLSYCFEETPVIRRHLEKGQRLRELNPIHRTKVFMQFMEYGAKRPLEFLIPYMDKTKRQMIMELPRELLEMTWFCRNPQEGKPCGICFNCKRVLPHYRQRK